MEYYLMCGTKIIGVGEMKKSLIFCLILLALISFMIIGCEDNLGGSDTELSSLSIHSSSPRSFNINEDIDLRLIRIVATYKDGTEEIIQLNDAMLTNEDREKFTTISTSHTIKIDYKGKSVLYNFSVTEAIPDTKYDVHFESNGGSKVDSLFTNVIHAFTVPIKAGFT